jgi:signal transduction histidine kinase
MFMERSAAGLRAHEFVLSNLSPTVAQRRFALGVVLVLLVVFVIVAGPLSGLPLRRVDAFIPAYGTAIFVIDSITAALLFAQFSVLRSPALLALANGYFLTALIAIPWTLTFPGVLAPEGGLGGGLQSTVWLYVVSHVGFALFAIVYTLLKDADPMEWLSPRSIRARVLTTVGSVTALVCCATVFVTAGHAFLPRIMLDTAEVSYLWYYVIGPMAALFVVALVLLWLRLRSVLDLWLMLVLFAYIIEIALTAFPIPYRFSVGWYAGRVYAVLSGSLVLLILMKEVTMLYGELLRAVLAQHREREARLLTGDAIAATVAHEIKQPLSAMTVNASASLGWLDRATPNIDEAKAALQRIVNNGHRAGAVIENIRTLFKRDDARTHTSLDVNNLIREALAFVRDDLQTHRIAIQADCNQSLPPIEGNQVQLQQVLVNLITNAIDSMATEDGDRVLSLKSKVYDSDSLIVSVEDVGKGVESSAFDLIFKPQFTTKVHGMGMGLSICRSIIEAHGGRLWVTANLPRGAIFHFTLPAHREH